MGLSPTYNGPLSTEVTGCLRADVGFPPPKSSTAAGIEPPPGRVILLHTQKLYNDKIMESNILIRSESIMGKKSDGKKGNIC